MRFGSFYVGEPDSNYAAQRARLLRFLRSKGQSREDAEDLIQEAMLRLRVYTRHNAVVSEDSFLRHAVLNLAIDQYRRNRLGYRREVSIEDVGPQHPLIAPSPTPERILDSQQRLDQLTAILDAVSRRTREVYVESRACCDFGDGPVHDLSWHRRYVMHCAGSVFGTPFCRPTSLGFLVYPALGSHRHD